MKRSSLLEYQEKGQRYECSKKGTEGISFAVKPSFFWFLSHQLIKACLKSSGFSLAPPGRLLKSFPHHISRNLLICKQNLYLASLFLYCSLNHLSLTKLSLSHEQQPPLFSDIYCWAGCRSIPSLSSSFVPCVLSALLHGCKPQTPQPAQKSSNAMCYVRLWGQSSSWGQPGGRWGSSSRPRHLGGDGAEWAWAATPGRLFCRWDLLEHEWRQMIPAHFSCLWAGTRRQHHTCVPEWHCGHADGP